MKTLKTTLLVLVLLSLVVIAGCQEGYAKKSNQPSWEPTQTGFWHLKTN